MPGSHMIFFMKQHTFHGLHSEDDIFAFYFGHFLQVALLVKAVQRVTW